MPVVISEIISMDPVYQGIRAKFAFTFTYGVYTEIGPFIVADITAANAKLLELIPRVEEKQRHIDAWEAVDLGISIAHKEADQNLVYLAWFTLAKSKTEAYQSYLALSAVAEQVLDLNLTDQEYADLFNSTIAEVQTVKNLWAYYDQKAKKQTLEDYIALSNEVGL